MNRSTALPWAGAGLFLLGLGLLPAGALSLGGPAAHTAVYLLLLALAGLALWLLRRLGLGREQMLAALLPIGLAVFLRALLLDYQSADYQMFLSQWAATFRDSGGFAAVKLPIGNYNAPYLYFLAAISYLPIPDLYLIKLFSVLFDGILAWGGFRLVRHFTPGDKNRPLLCSCLLLLLPTVVANGAFWGQCDALYGALVLHALSSPLEGRPCASLALLGAAFSCKLQTVFVLPLWGLLWFIRRVKFRQLLVFPGVYLLTAVPALLLGKPLGDILGVYFDQAGQYPQLTANAPSVYQYLPNGMYSTGNWYALVGIAAAAVAVAVLLIAGVLLGRRLDRRALLAMAVVMAAAIPWLLPHMHERYFFLADILSVCLACVCLRAIPAAALICGTSLASYRVFLRLKFNCYLTIGGVGYGMPVEATCMLAGVICAAVVLVQELRCCAGTERKKGGARLC